MRILISGVSGMVGYHVAKSLLEAGHEVIGIASLDHKGKEENICSLNKEFPTYPEEEDKFILIRKDLNYEFSTAEKNQFKNIDIILNIASESHVDRSITDPVPFIKNNINLTLNMLELARGIKPKLFLQFSTDESYGVAPEGINHSEWSPHIPSNPYAASKACQEDIAISYWRTYGVPVVITNTMNIFSEIQDWEKFIPLCVKKILLDEEITIHAYPGATKAGSRFYIHADSVAEAIKFLIEKPVGLYPNVDRPDRYNIVGDREIDNEALAKKIAYILNKEIKYQLVDFHSSRPGHDARYGLDGTKLAEAGWKPTANFEEKLKGTVLKLKEKFDTEYSK